MRTNLLLLATSVGVSLLALEIIARFYLPAPLPWRYPQTRYQADPALIFRLAPNQQTFSADKAVTTNERGLRGALVPYERVPGRLRLLFIGDSIVFGYGVADDDVLTSRVSTQLGQQGVSTEVINAAVPAYNTEQEVTYLDREGVRYRPDWVIVGVCWNDISDKSAVRVSADGDLISQTGDDQQRAAWSQSPAGYAVRNGLKRSRLMYATLQAWRALAGRVSPDDLSLMRADVLEGRATPYVEAGWQRVAAAIHHLKQLSDAYGFRPLLVAFPLPLAVERQFPHSSYPARLGEAAAHEGMPLIDLRDPFRIAYHGHESLFIPYDGDHPNAAGHDLAAREIVKFLTSGASRGTPQQHSLAGK